MMELNCLLLSVKLYTDILDRSRYTWVYRTHETTCTLYSRMFHGLCQTIMMENYKAFKEDLVQRAYSSSFVGHGRSVNNIGLLLKGQDICKFDFIPYFSFYIPL